MQRMSLTRTRTAHSFTSRSSNALACLVAVVLAASACNEDDEPDEGARAGKGGGAGAGASGAKAGSGGLPGSGGNAGEGGRVDGGEGGNGASSAAGTAGVAGSSGSGGSENVGGQGGEGGEGEIGGAGGESGGQNPGNSCTGPGPDNAGTVSGFPPGPTASLDSGPWSGWAVSHGNLDAATDVDGVDSALHTAAPGDSRTSYFLAPTDGLGDLSAIAGVRFALKTEYTGGGYYESGYQYKGDVVLRGANGNTTAYAIIAHAPDSEWHDYYVPFQAADTCWSTAEDSLAELLTSVTGLGIRAEYSTGTDNTWLANFELVPRP
jgi:hypothetical protein